MPYLLPILTIFLLPIYLLKIHLTPSISINLLELLLIYTLTIIYYAIFKQFSFQKIIRWSLPGQNKKIFLPILLIVAGFTLSYLHHQQLTHWKDWTDGLGKLLDLIILPILFGFAIHFLAIINIKGFFLKSKLDSPFLRLLQFFPPGMTLNVIYYFSVAIVAFLGIIFLITGHLTFDHRLKIFFSSPNQLAMFLSPALIIGFSFIFSQFNRSAKESFKKFWLLYSSIFAIIINIFFTKSLGSWLALSFVALLLFAYYNVVKNPVFKKLIQFFQKYSLKIIALIIILTTLAIFNVNQIITFTSYHPHTPPTSTNSRLAIYQVTRKIISQNRLWGIGPGSFQGEYLKEQQNFPAYPQWAVPHAHNNLLHFWAEGGILAFIGLIFIYINIFNIDDSRRVILANQPFNNQNKSETKTKSQNNKKGKLQQKKELPQLPFPQLTLLYFVLHGLIDTTIWTMPTAIFFWLTVIYYLTNQPDLGSIS